MIPQLHELCSQVHTRKSELEALYLHVTSISFFKDGKICD